MKNAVKMHSMEFCFTRIISLRLTLIFEILKVGVWLIWIFAINFDSFYSVLLNFKIPRFFQEHSMILEKKIEIRRDSWFRVGQSSSKCLFEWFTECQLLHFAVDCYLKKKCYWNSKPLVMNLWLIESFFLKWFEKSNRTEKSYAFTLIARGDGTQVIPNWS